MEVAEDDVFFADLSKQISLLIMDDDEDPIVHCPSVSFQAFSRAIHHPNTQSPEKFHPNTQLPVFYEQTYRRESKGTGVFIPRSTQPRRKSKQGRFTSSNTKFHRHSDTSIGLPYVPNNNNISHNSFNSKKC